MFRRFALIFGVKEEDIHLSDSGEIIVDNYNGVKRLVGFRIVSGLFISKNCLVIRIENPFG